MKKKILASSVLTIALCLSLIAGGTFALFSVSSETNVAVTSGKVDVVATIKNVQMGSELGSNVPETSYTMSEGENEIAITGMVPGDFITFELHVQNNSNVTVNYRTVLKVMENSGLWEGLTVTVNGENYEGNTRISNWEQLGTGNAPAVVYVKVLLPKTASNEYQGKTCSFAYTVEAVQGNASVQDADADTLEIYNAIDLLLFADKVKAGNAYTGKTVVLMNDIDLTGVSFTGIGVNNTSNFSSGAFDGTFDGNNYTVSNMTVSSDFTECAAAGFFNTLGHNASVKNLKIDSASVTSTHYAGAIVGYAHSNNGSVIENCHVTNSEITSVTEKIGSQYTNGDKAGGIAGYSSNFTVLNCSVKNTDVYAYRDIGGVVGYANCNVEGCVVENVTVTSNSVHNYKNYTSNSQYDADEFVGESYGNVNCTGSYNSVVYAALVRNSEELKASLAKGGYIVLVNDIDMNGEKYDPEVNVGQDYPGVVIDGNNKTIVGLANSLINCESNTTVEIKNLTVKNANISESYDDAQGMGTAAFVGYMDENCVLTMTNCHLKDSTVKGTADYPGVAGLVGYKSNGGILNIENCSVKNSVIEGVSNAAGVVGYITSSASIIDCTVSGNTITGEKADKQGAIVGTVNGGTVNVGICNIDGVMCGRVLSGSLVCDGSQWIADGVAKNSEGEYLISNANGMFWLADQVNVSGKSFNGETVKLTADIDLKNQAWTPIGNNSCWMFYGTFDGQEHTISNLSVTDARTGDNSLTDNDGVGLFGWLNGSVKDLKICGATVVGYHNVGVIAGYQQFGSIENCEVKNASVIGKHIGSELCADKVGGIVGVSYAANDGTFIKNCRIIDSTVLGGRDIGKIAGATVDLNDVIGCNATNVTIGYYNGTDGNCTRNENLGDCLDGLVGRDI